MAAHISVIVPIYNVEPYLERCVDSILAQTYTDIEIILVDDGSPDRCGEICDAYRKKDSRIRVVHKPNGGLSSARNAGLDIATGKYVMFTDSDDFIDPTMLEDMVHAMEQNDADIVTVNVRSESENGVEKERVMPMVDEVRTFEKTDFIQLETIYGKQVSIFSVNNLYRMDIINRYALRFLPTQTVLSEDQLFNFCYYASVKKGVYISKSYYNYIVRRNTLSRSRTPASALDRRVTWVRELMRYIDDHHLEKQSWTFYAYRTWQFFENGCRSIGEAEAILNGIRQIESGENRRFYRKALRSMLLGRAGRMYIRENKMDLRGSVYFRLMVLLLLMGKHDRPVRTYLCDAQ